MFFALEYRQIIRTKERVSESSRLIGVDYSCLFRARSLGGNQSADKLRMVPPFNFIIMKHFFLLLLIFLSPMKVFSQANFTEAGKIAVDKALSKSYLGIGNVITYFDKFHSIGDSITTNKNKLLFPYKDYVSWGFSNFSTCDLAE